MFLYQVEARIDYFPKHFEIGRWESLI